MIDTHSHIDFDCFEAKLDEILKSAQESGIEKIIIPGVREQEFSRIIDLIEKYDCLYGALGVHPSEAKSCTKEVLDAIEKLASHPKIVAIGEIGLDYYWDKSEIDKQKEVFISQIEIAKRTNKPIIIHDREAHEDTFNILKELNAREVGVVMHCFSGSVEYAKQCIKEGYYIALGGVVTFKNAKKPKEVAHEIPLEFLLLETDAPYLTPVPHRGEENQPAYVRFVAEEIARIKNINIQEVDKQTTLNACNLFKFCESSNE